MVTTEQKLYMYLYITKLIRQWQGTPDFNWKIHFITHYLLLSH